MPNLANIGVDTVRKTGMMNAKLRQQMFWTCHENGLIKTILTIPHEPQPLYEFQVSFLLFWIKINLSKPFKATVRGSQHETHIGHWNS